VQINTDQTVRIDYDNLDTFDLMTVEQISKIMSIRGTGDSGQCSFKTFGIWNSLWWDMKPSWKE